MGVVGIGINLWRSEMTNKEKVIVSAYTGILMCNFSDLHEYAEKLFGRPIFTHELGDGKTAKKLKTTLFSPMLKLATFTLLLPVAASTHQN